MNETCTLARTVREIMGLGQGLAVRCRDCSTVRSPILENVAARIGYDTPIGPEIVFLCSSCGSRDTCVTLTETESRLVGVTRGSGTRVADPADGR